MFVNGAVCNALGCKIMAQGKETHTQHTEFYVGFCVGLYLKYPPSPSLGSVRDKFANGMRGDFFQVFGSKTKPDDCVRGNRGSRGTRWGAGRMRGWRGRQTKLL